MNIQNEYSPTQRRKLIALYIECKLKERNKNFVLSDFLQKIAQFRYAETGHNFIQYENEILSYLKKQDNENYLETYKLTLIERGII